MKKDKIKKVLEVKHTSRNMYDTKSAKDNSGQWAIIKPSSLRSNCRNKNNQLFKLSGGFGCNPDGRGNACFGNFIDGEKTRMEKYEFIGIADKKTARWANKQERKHKKVGKRSDN